MNDCQLNLYTTRDLDGCLCAVLSHVWAAKRMGGITVHWINPGDASSVSQLVWGLTAANAYDTPLPREREVLVCGAQLTESMRTQFRDLASPAHKIDVWNWLTTDASPMVCHLWTELFATDMALASRAVMYLAYDMLTHGENRGHMAALLGELGPDNFVSVLTRYCINHPSEALRLSNFSSIGQFLTYAGHC